MAKFGGMTLTKEGRMLLAKALTGKELKFVRVVSGDGYLPEDANIYDLTEMVHPVRDLPINSVNVTGVGTATVRAVMTNRDLGMGFFIREMGLFAEDPETGAEVLYGYCNAGDEADYMPGQDGPDAVEYLFSLIAVIDQAEHVTAVIDGGLVYATRDELRTRVDELFARSAPIFEFWTRSQGDGNLLRPSSIDDVRQVILGITDIESLNKRVERIEDAVAQILLELETQNLYPDYTHWICEDFRVVNQVDLYTCKITSVVAGDDSLDCEPVYGLLPGSYYTITDGISYELVQAKSINIENGIHRLILMEPLRNTYRLETCSLYRTSATIGYGYASGPTGKQTKSWMPSEVWKGQGANEPFEIPLSVSLGNSGNYAMDGDVGITADGFVTLEAM